MKTRVDARLRAEAAIFAFRFACEDCAHFAPSSHETDSRCSLEYPAVPRQSALGAPPGQSALDVPSGQRALGAPPGQSALDVAEPAEVELCKAFELG